ncbi:MAG: hypothetical protein KBD51_02900 [Candidatus Levybacteria bacterium]|nr:hypothetical protein [Candidatus Levybacteria bacterium]
MTEALNTSIGAHPNTRSESNQAYWKSITSSAVAGRTIELTTVAQTPKVVDTFTPLFDQGSFMDRVGSVASKFAKPALVTGGAAAGIAGAAIVVDLDGKYVSAQEPSTAPSAEPSVEPTPSVTPDPITGLLPCPTPEASPKPGETPIPERTIDPGIGKVGGEVLFAQAASSSGETVIVTLAQEAPSAAPSGAPEASPAASVTPNPETAVNPNCDPVLTEAYIKAGKPEDKEPVKFSFMDEAIEAPISIGELKGIIKSFYAKHPEALNYVDEYDTKLTTKTRNRMLKQCEKGYPDDPKELIQQSRVSSCAGLIRYIYFIAKENKSQGMMELAQSVYWYALANIKASDPASAIEEFLGGVEIKKQVIQG